MRKWIASFLIVVLCISTMQVSIYGVESTKSFEESFDSSLDAWSQKESGGGPLPEFDFVQQEGRNVLHASMTQALGYIESVRIPVNYKDQLDLNVVLKNTLIENMDPAKDGVFFRINQFETASSAPITPERLELMAVSGTKDWRTQTASFEITNPDVNYISVQVVFGWWTTSKVSGDLYIDHIDITRHEQPEESVEDGLLANPKFENGLDQWKLIANGGSLPLKEVIQGAQYQGGNAIEFMLEDTSAYLMSEKIPVEQGDEYVVNIHHMQQNLENVNTSRAAIYIRASYYEDVAASPIKQVELGAYSNTRDWSVDQYTFTIDDEAYNYVSIHVVFGWWTNSEANGTYGLDYIQLLKEGSGDLTDPEDPENPEDPEVEQEDIAYNGDFAIVKETQEAYWAKGTKPDGWRYQYRPEFAVDGAAEPIIDVDAQGNIEMVLDSSVSWIEPETEHRIPIVNGAQYQVKTLVKGNLITAHSSQVPIFLRVELVDSQGNYIEGTRATLDSLTNGVYSDWTPLFGQYVVNHPDATHLKVVLFLGQWGSGNGASGEVLVDQIQVLADVVLVEHVDIESDQVTIRKGNTASLEYSVYPGDATNQQVKWYSSDENIVSVDAQGTITGQGEGTATITLQSLDDETITDKCEVTIVDGYIPVNEVVIDRERLVLDVGTGRQLLATAYPEYASDKSVIWSVADASIASIDQGFVKGISVGTTTVIAKSLDQEHIYDTLELEVTMQADDDYDLLRRKWFDSIVGGVAPNLDDASTRVLIENIEQAGYDAWKSMDTESDAYLWESSSDFSASSTVTQNFNYLNQMAKAYQITGSDLQGNVELLQDIVYGLEWMNRHHYKADVWYGNWWDWEIGSAQHIIDTLVLIHDDVEPALIDAYVDALDWYVPDPRYFSKKWHVLSTGANRSDLCLVVLGSGILDKDEAKILDASHSLEVVYEYVDSGDGFYEDGSFVQHYHVPYTGTYGSILFSGIGRIFNILSDSPWEKESESVNNVYEMLIKGVQPLIYRGMMMDMVSGRSVARQDIGERKHGIGMIKRMVEYSSFAPEPYASEIKSMVKYWIESNDYLDFLDSANDLNILLQAQGILNDSSVQSRGPLVGNYVFADMDRIVHRNASYAAGISMYSNRISNYESLNQENLHGWHTGDGMLYLYHEDLGHFTQDYWSTVNPYRLPGTTVDTKVLSDAAGERKKSKESFVGGVTLENTYGVAAMQLNKDNDQVGMDLKAKKAWFFFDNEIVALGTDIHSSQGRTIETIVENRKISDAATETLVINGKKIEHDGIIHEKEVDWAYLSNGIGYYFPEQETLKILLEQREGYWKDINGAARFVDGDKPVTGNYVTLWKDHGIDPAMEQYSYVLLPSMNKSSQVKKYYKKPEVKILRNDSSAQIVKESTTGLTGYVFWEEDTHLDEETMIQSISHPGIVMTQDQEARWIVSYADPTQKLQDEVEIVLNASELTVENKSEAISVIEQDQYTYIYIDLSAVDGETQEVAFSIKEEKPGNGKPKKEKPNK